MPTNETITYNKSHHAPINMTTFSHCSYISKMHCYFLFLLVAFAVFPDAETAATEELVVNPDDWFYKVSECTNSGLQCWTVPPTYRISSETEKESPYQATRSGLYLSGAANEFETFQIALKSETTDLASCTASLGDFSPALGSATERRVEIYTAGYHPTEKLADSLTRLVDGTSTFQVNSSAGQAATILWVRVYIPADAAKGEYSTNLVIKSGGTTLVTIPVKLTVFGFTLPVSSTFQTQINIDVEQLRPSFLTTELEKVDWAKQFLLEYRMTPKSVSWSSGLSYSIAWDNSNPNGPGQCSKINEEDYESLPYSAGKNTRRYALGENWPLKRWMVDSDSPLCDGDSCPDSIRTNSGFSTSMLFQFPSNSAPRPNTFCGISIGSDQFGTDQYNAEWSEFLSALNSYVSAQGALASKAYIYVQNEPQNDNDAKLANHLCRIYKQAAPNIKIAISEEAKPDIAERSDPCGYDIWIAHVVAYDKYYAWERLERHGEESWFYSLRQDTDAYFSPTKDDVGVNDGMNIRVIPWVAFKARIRGWAYYDMSIFFEGKYPLRPKIGAEIFRDAMEDYEYMFLANGKRHPMPNVLESADPVVNAVGFSFTAWSRDHAQFAAIRHELGRYIDGSRSTIAVPPAAAPVTDPLFINFQDPDSSSTPGDLIVGNNTYIKVGWDAFDRAKGYGWSGDGIGQGRLFYEERSGGANLLENLYIYNNFGNENVFDIAVANGRWRVTVAVGRPRDTRDDPQDVVVNGKVFNDAKISNVQYFTQDVDVTDGFLNVVFGRTFNKYCFISQLLATPIPVEPDTTRECGIFHRGKFCPFQRFLDLLRRLFGK